ncbi:ERF family protein [uncultured Clostridium sp.]|uniref:ERF family protein n=1 Tax=uncultured Clostridium sp. TaxID=59620 RepID=UPI002624C521|nr:ERF family protein [uncultured Clostridium sp.]
MEGRKIHLKLAEARVKLLEIELKKTGYNKFSNYEYYELGDFLPHINKINFELKMVSIFIPGAEKSTLTFYDCESEESIEFSIDRCQVNIKGAANIQNLGGEQTYLRRYLYLNAYEISETDTVDLQPKTQQKEEKPNRNTKVDSEFEQSKPEQKPFDRQKCIEFILKLVGEDVDRLNAQLEPYGIKGLGEASDIALGIIYDNLSIEEYRNRILKATGEDEEKLKKQLAYHKIEKLEDANIKQLKLIHKYITGGKQ